MIEGLKTQSLQRIFQVVRGNIWFPLLIVFKVAQCLAHRPLLDLNGKDCAIIHHKPQCWKRPCCCLAGQDRPASLSVSHSSPGETDQLERERCMKRFIAGNWLRWLWALLGKSNTFRASSQTGTLGHGLKLLSSGRISSWNSQAHLDY